MRAYVFPGQGAQFPGMAKELFESSAKARNYFKKANRILGFEITDIMFNGSDEDLKQTDAAQPAIFLHSVVRALTLKEFEPQMVAGHSLGEFSALVAIKALSFESGLKLVAKRAKAMQKACEENPSTMAAILGMEDDEVARICASIDDVVVLANYNCPGQIVISGTNRGVDLACEKLSDAGAKRVIKLNVGGAFHSPLMASAKLELEDAISTTAVNKPICPIYQNVTAQVVSNPDIIKANLIAQLTAPVRWTQTIKEMLSDGATSFTEIGPGRVLTGLIRKVNRQVATSSEG